MCCNHPKILLAVQHRQGGFGWISKKTLSSRISHYMAGPRPKGSFGVRRFPGKTKAKRMLARRTPFTAISKGIRGPKGADQRNGMRSSSRANREESRTTQRPPQLLSSCANPLPPSQSSCWCPASPFPTPSPFLPAAAPSPLPGLPPLAVLAVLLFLHPPQAPAVLPRQLGAGSLTAREFPCQVPDSSAHHHSAPPSPLPSPGLLAVVPPGARPSSKPHRLCHKL